MADEKLKGCDCLLKSEKDMILESLSLKLSAITKEEMEIGRMGYLIAQRVVAESVRDKVINTPLCK